MKKPKTIRPVRPDLALEAMYRGRLDKWLAAMHADLMRELRAAYAEETPLIAVDALASTVMRDAMNRLSRKWQKRFDQGSTELAQFFAQSAAERTDTQLRMILRKAGWTVKFDKTLAQREQIAAAVAENVSLIRSIASKHLTQVDGDVMRAVAMGLNWKQLTDDLEHNYGVSRRRAKFIARDQINKTTAAITRVRQQELGITEALWKHSHAGKHPRPSHLAADGKRYKIAEGMLLDGVWTWPGREINCRCVSQSIIPGIHE